MLKAFCRLNANAHSTKQFLLHGRRFYNIRLSSSLTHQDPQQRDAFLKILNPDQNPLSKDESYQSAPEIPTVRRRRLSHPKNLLEAVIRSQFLQNMVDIGVNLYEIQHLRPRDFDFIVSLRSFDPDPPERIRFLLELGVEPEAISRIITKNPWILKENLEDMQIRVNYLESKKFIREDIAKIVAGCPKLLTTLTKDIDSRLGYFQQGYKLSGDQVRHVALTYPWMISWPEKKLVDTLDTLTDRLSFNITHMKNLILNHGELWRKDVPDIIQTAKFLHKDLKISHRQMALHGHLLTKSQFKMKFRYDFMVFMNRANFDPTKPNYYSYDILWDGTLEEFCNKLHTSTEALDLYAKSL